MQGFLKQINNYVLSFLLIALALAFFVVYLTAPDMEDQPTEMLVGALFLLVAGVLALPAVAQKIGTSLSRILGVVFFIFSMLLAYMIFNTVDDEIQFLAEKEKMDTSVIQRLKDIRTAQEEYMKQYGQYTNNWDSLLAFISEPMLEVPWKSGDLADSLLEKSPEEQAAFIIHRDSLASMGLSLEQAVKRGYSVRDTSYISVYDQYFNPDFRAKKNLPEVNLDSLPFSPYSGERFILKTGMIEASGGVKQPTILVQDPTPFGREGVKKDTLRFGSLSESSTSGNWGSR